jgi:hypothetical protein
MPSRAVVLASTGISINFAKDVFHLIGFDTGHRVEQDTASIVPT